MVAGGGGGRSGPPAGFRRGRPSWAGIGRAVEATAANTPDVDRAAAGFDVPLFLCPLSPPSPLLRMVLAGEWSARATVALDRSVNITAGSRDINFA